jgi:hypothetical protein
MEAAGGISLDHIIILHQPYGCRISKHKHENVRSAAAHAVRPTLRWFGGAHAQTCCTGWYVTTTIALQTTLTDLVREFGPLWTHSMFILEHMGGRSVATCHAKKTAIAHSIFHHFLVLHNHRTLTTSLGLTEDSNILVLIIISYTTSKFDVHHKTQNYYQD